MTAPNHPRSAIAPNAASPAVSRGLLVALIALALAGCQEGDGEIVAKTGPIGSVVKTCDGHRAIYTYKSGYAGGIAIVENAEECPRNGGVDGDMEIAQ